MIPQPRLRFDFKDRGQTYNGRVLTTLGTLGLIGVLGASGETGCGERTASVHRTSMAEAHDVESPESVPRALLARLDSTAADPRAEGQVDPEVMLAQNRAAETKSATASSSDKAKSTPLETPGPTGDADRQDVPRIASAAGRARVEGLELDPGSAPSQSTSPSIATTAADHDPIAMAKQAIADSAARFKKVQDYTCVFHKRERIDGQLTQPYILTMKARTQPHSVYFKFQRPKKGREAIYVAGRNSGKVVVHDVGLGKLLAGTMNLDPHGSMAMEECRHPVTEAGIGALIETVRRHWSTELTPGESLVTIHKNVRVGNHPCTMIESIHPKKHPNYLFHKVKLYIDHEHGLPIRFEAYDWPHHPGLSPELVEEYSYLNLKTNIGLRDQDFDVANPQYSYGRF